MRTLLALVFVIPLFAQDGLQPIKCGWSKPGAIHKARSQAQLSRPERELTYFSNDSSFAIHYDTSAVSPNHPPMASTRPDGVPDWIIETADAFMHASNLLMQRGYPSPPYDGDRSYDIYIIDNNGGLYGETVFESDVGQGIRSYIEIEDDFAEAYYTHGIPALRTTAAHEYFHAVQLAYGFLNGGGYFYELTSTWFEELANPTVDDWIYWFRLDPPYNNSDFGSHPDRHLSDTDGYSAAIFGHYLTWVAADSSIMHAVWDRVPALIASNGRFMDEIDRQLALANIDLAEKWADFVSRLFLNGMVHDGQFHPDQLLLPQPAVYDWDEQTIDGEELLTYPNLALGECNVTVLLVNEVSDLKISKVSQSGNGTFGARVFRENIFEVGDNNWVGRDIDVGERVILVVAGDLLELVLSVEPLEPGGDIYFTLDAVGPNPIPIASSAATPLTIKIKYTVFDEYTALDHEVTLYNLLGQQVYKYSYQASLLPMVSITKELDISPFKRLPSGVYILAFTLDGRTTNRRTLTLIK